jgi:hypothetical protein
VAASRTARRHRLGDARRIIARITDSDDDETEKLLVDALRSLVDGAAATFIARVEQVPLVDAVGRRRFD